MTKREEEEATVYLDGKYWSAETITRWSKMRMGAYDYFLERYLRDRSRDIPHDNWRNDPTYFSALAKRWKREGKI